MSSTAPAIPRSSSSTASIHLCSVERDLYVQEPQSSGCVALWIRGTNSGLFVENMDELALLALKITEYLEAHTAKDAEQAA